MPTDAFEIIDSGTSTRSVFTPGSSVTILNTLRTMLLAAWWTEGTATRAKFRIEMPYGMLRSSPGVPIEDAPPDNGLPMISFDLESEDPVSIVMFDATRRSPGTRPDTIYVGAGMTVEGSVAGLADTIDTHTAWHVTDYGQDTRTLVWYIDVEAKTAGANRNSVSLAGGTGSVHTHTSFWCRVPRQPYNGGWVLRSINPATSEWLEVWMYSPAGTSAAAFEFRSSTGGAEPTFYLAPARSAIAGRRDPTWKYTIIACQFQFAIFADQGEAHFLFASMPYLQGGCEYAALILSNGARTSLRWRGTNGKWASARDGELTSVMSGNHAGCFPGFFMLRQIGTPLLTTQGFPITESAYIGLPTGRATSADGHSRVVGKIWDAMILSKAATLGDRFEHRSRQWQCVFSTSSFGTVRASVWIAYTNAP